MIYVIHIRKATIRKDFLPDFELNHKGEIELMSEKHPECPLYNPLNCKEYYNPKLCAFVRKDRICLKKKKPVKKTKAKDLNSD